MKARKHVVLWSSLVLVMAGALSGRMLSAATTFSRHVIDSGFAGDVKGIGDMNGDGFPDLVIGGFQMYVYIYPNWTRQLVSTANVEFTTDMQLGDVDNDGDLDIVTADGGSGNNVIWLENPFPTTSSNWTRRTIGQHPSWAHDIEIGDLDRDGRIDVITRGQQQVNLFFQNTPTSWTRRDISSVVGLGEGLGIGDVNGDGYLDLAAAGSWFSSPTNPRTGTWGAHFIAGTGAVTAAIGDMNNDGRADVLFAAQHNRTTLAWYEAPTDPVNGTWLQHVIDPSMGSHKLSLGDFNKDGRLDVVAGLELSELSLYLSVGDAAFTFTKQVLSTTGTHNQRIGDIGNDGDLDIFGANYLNNPPVELWENTSPSTALPLNLWTYKSVSNAHEQTFGLAFGDLNSDGRKDIVSGASWYQNPGSDMLGTWTQGGLPSGMHAILVTNVDGDAFADVIAQKNESNLSLYWLEATDLGATSWISVRIGGVPAASHTLGAQGYRVAQVETGGLPEVLISSGNGVYYFRIPASPSSGNWPMIQVNANPSDEGFAVGDIDRDGNLDVIATTGNNKGVEWYRNPGTGAAGWQAFPLGSAPEMVYPDRIELADFDRDGRLDVVVSEENGIASGAVTYWWRQPATATAANWSRQLIATQGTTNSMDVADMDADGDVDLILAEHRGSLTLSIRASSGTGSFSSNVVSVGRESHLGARAVDLDNDGDLDIVSIAFDAPQNLHMWRNDALGGSADTTPPTVSITAPAAGSTVSGTVTVSANAADNVGVSGVQFRLDGVNLGAEDVTAPYAVAWNTTTAAAGSHSLSAVARDAAGNLASTAISVTIQALPDTTSPTVSITAPAAGSTVSGTVTVSANAADNVGVAGVQFRLNGVNLGAEDGTAPYAVAWNTATAAAGSHTLSALARDAAGNLGSTAITVMIAAGADTTPPTVSITAPAAGSTVSGTVTVSANAADNLGVAGVQFRLNGVNLGAEDVTAPYSVAWNTTTAAVGSHSLSAVARDAAGNLASTAITVTIEALPDTTLPTVLIMAPAAGSTVSGTVTVAANAADNVGVAGVQFRLNGVNLGAEDVTAPYSVAWNTTTAAVGSHSLSAVARDAAGNLASTAITVTVAIDGGDITSNLIGYWTFDEGSGTTAQDTAGSHPGILRNGPTWAPGKLGQAVSFDGANDFVDVGILDITGSALTIAAWIYADTFAVDDARILSKSTGSAEQDHYFMLSTLASGGSKLRFRLKTGTTTSTLIAPAGTLATGQWIHVAAVYDGSSMILYKDGMEVGRMAKTGVLATSATTGVAIGQNPQPYGPFDGTIDDVRVYQRALTPASIGALMLLASSTPPDTTPPALSITAPAAGSTVSGTVTVSANAADDVGVAGVQFRLDGVNLGAEDVTAPYSVAWNTTTAAAGSHSLSAVARDAAGNLASTAVTVTIEALPDTTLPTVSITAPAAGSTVSGTVAVSASAADNVGVAGVQFRLDGVSLGAEDLTAPYTVAWNTMTAAVGSHSLSAVARDAAGNLASTAITVMIEAPPDTTLPTVLITAPASGSAVSGTVTVSANAADNVGVAGVQFRLNGVNLGAEDVTAPYAVAWNTTTAAAGSHTLSAVARDAAGNVATTAITVTVADTTPPTVSITAPAAGSTVSGTVTVSANALDAGGIAGVQFRLDGVNLGGEDVTAPYAVAWNTTTAAAGSHSLSAVARDVGGNLTSTAITVMIEALPDTALPTVSITAPAAGSTVSGTVAVSANAVDAGGIAGVQFRLDGVTLGAEDVTAPYSVMWNTTTVSVGSHSLSAVARDAAGNLATATVAVTVAVSGGGDVTSNLIGHWKFDEGSGTTAQDSAGSHPGTLGNGPIWVPGRLGQAVSFDGVNDVVNLGILDVTGSALTIAAWINADTFAIDDARVLSKSTGSAEQAHYFMLSTIASGGSKLRFRLRTGTNTSTLIAPTGTLATGQWIHVAAVYNGSAMILYVNGVEVGRMAKTGGLAVSATTGVAIGRNPQAYGAFDGAIDDVRLYQRALSVADVLTLAGMD